MNSGRPKSVVFKFKFWPQKRSFNIRQPAPLRILIKLHAFLKNGLNIG